MTDSDAIDQPASATMNVKKKILAARQARAEGKLTAADITAFNLQLAARRRPIILADPDPTDAVVIFDVDPTDRVVVIEP